METTEREIEEMKLLDMGGKEVRLSIWTEITVVLTFVIVGIGIRPIMAVT